MPKRADIKKVMIIGSGPIIIGQACEFDYSGTQACKALKSLGYEIVLVNSNPATIMTDPSTADHTYMEVFIKCLWRTETAGISDAQIHILCGIETEVGTWTEYDMVYKVVLVKSATQEETPLLVLPFILEEHTADADILLEVAVVTEYDILQTVEVVLCTKGQV